MNFKFTLYIFSFVSMGIDNTECTDYSDQQELQSILLKNYSKIITPSFNQSRNFEVIVDLYMISLIDFDTVSGIMKFSGALFLWWKDEIIESRWQHSEYTHINEIELRVSDVWMPKIVVRNTAQMASLIQFTNPLEIEKATVLYDSEGYAYFMSQLILQTTCTTDVTYYPADKHSCEVALVTFDDWNKIVLVTSVSSVLTNYTNANSEWTLSSTVKLASDDFLKELIFFVFLSRRPTFQMTNLVFPVIIITVVNGLSFLLPIDSGERLSFGTSLLLTFIIFLTTVVDNLPPTENLSIFNICVFVQLIYSCLIVCGIICTNHLYYHPEGKNIPKVLRKLTLIVLRRQIQTLPESTSVKHASDLKSTVQTKVKAFESDNKNDDSDAEQTSICQDITWREAATAVDTVLRAITTFLSFCMIFMFIVLDILLKRSRPD